MRGDGNRPLADLELFERTRRQSLAGRTVAGHLLVCGRERLLIAHLTSSSRRRPRPPESVSVRVFASSQHKCIPRFTPHSNETLRHVQLDPAWRRRVRMVSVNVIVTNALQLTRGSRPPRPPNTSFPTAAVGPAPLRPSCLSSRARDPIKDPSGFAASTRPRPETMTPRGS